MKTVSRQRRNQIARNRAGLCQYCTEPLFTTTFCHRHAIAARELARKRKGCIQRYSKARTYAFPEDYSI